MLEREELKQYNRQIILPEIGLEGQQKLKNASVLMIGAGGLGCPVLQYLAAAGVGTIGIIDDDVIDISNLHRQILYSVADVGKPKVVTAKLKLQQLNPHVNIIAHPERFTPENAQAISTHYDLLIDGSDNFTTRYLVSDTCTALNKVLVFGSVFKFEGHVAVFNYRGGANYRDLFPEPPPIDEVPNCDEIGVIGVLPGIIGLYMVNEAIKIICGIGETLAGKLMTIDALNNTTTIFSIVKQNGTIAPKQITDEPLQADGEISIDKFNLWQQQIPDKIQLVDVRETYEFEDYNIGGINIPLYELTEQIDLLPTHKKLVFCCQHGQRSKMAIQFIKQIYKGEMYSIQNGIL